MYQCEIPIKVKKVSELANVTKNSARLTEPIVYLAFRPPATSVDVTTGPQPPPPKESRKPPTKAKGNIFLIRSRILSFFNALNMMTKPRNKV